MFTRPEVSNLVSKGPLPDSRAGVQRIKEWQEAFETIVQPITDEEAIALTRLFPGTEDDCYGIAWSLVHLVETAPHWPLKESLQDTSKPWIKLLLQRLDDMDE